MKTTPIGAAALSLALTVAWGPTFAQSPTWSPPAEKDRCPSKWGAGDEGGSGNHIKPASVMKAVQLINEMQRCALTI